MFPKFTPRLFQLTHVSSSLSLSLPFHPLKPHPIPSLHPSHLIATRPASLFLSSLPFSAQTQNTSCPPIQSALGRLTPCPRRRRGGKAKWGIAGRITRAVVSFTSAATAATLLSVRPTRLASLGAHRGRRLARAPCWIKWLNGGGRSERSLCSAALGLACLSASRAWLPTYRGAVCCGVGWSSFVSCGGSGSGGGGGNVGRYDAVDDASPSN